MSSHARTPNRFKIGLGTIAQLSRPSSKRGRPARKYYRIPRRPTTSPRTSSSPPPVVRSPPSPSPAPTSHTTTSVFTSSFDVRSDSAPTDPFNFVYPAGTVLPAPSLLSEDDLDTRHTTDAQFIRSLHNELAGANDEEVQVKPSTWVHYNRHLDLDTPGITYTRNFLYRKTLSAVESEKYCSTAVSLDTLPEMFDQLYHDYNIKQQTVSRRVAIQWISPSGLRPADIRGRRFRLHLRDQNDLQHKDKLVWRSEYNCDGACQMAPADGVSLSFEKTPQDIADYIERAKERFWLRTRYGARADKGTDEHGPIDTNYPISDDSEGEEGEEEDDRPERNAVRGHNCRAKLFLTITVGQIDTKQCTVNYYKPTLHDPCPELHRLRPSATLKDEIFRASLGMGMTAGRLRTWFLDTMVKKHPHAIFVERKCSHRMPVRRAFDQAIKTVLRQQRLDDDPLVAIDHLAKINPSLFLHIAHTGTISHPDIPAEKKEPLSCIIAPPHALDNGLLYGLYNGLFMDSSWRNKNSHRAPMTVLATHDDLHRMVPIAVMISQHGGEEQYFEFLTVVKKAIEERARAINGAIEEPAKASALHDRVRSNAAEVVEDETFMPPFMMIDGCDSERAAIDRVWPNIYKRVCQFHLMQAVRGHCRTYFGASEAGELKTSAVLDAIRLVQRCPDEDEWDACWEQLGLSVTAIAGDTGDTWRDLSRHLKRHWFSDRWIKYCVDYGLPHATFAEGPWSTNNYVESTFRVFDRVLLCGRSNKRLDRLVVIIIRFYFPFYEYLPHTEPRPDPHLSRVLADGINSWQNDHCRQLHPESNHIPISLRNRTKRVFAVRLPRETKDHFPHELNVGDGRWQCTCIHWSRSGKQCGHLWASGILAEFGPIGSYEANCDLIASSRKGLKRTNRSSPLNDSDTPLGHDLVKEQDMDEDLRLYWKEDLFSQPYLPNLNTCPDLPSDMLQRYQTQVATAIEETVPQPRKTPTYRPGPAPIITPLNRSRAKGPRTTIRIPDRAKAAIDRIIPTGIVNTGQDCYGTSLLQILLRTSEWKAALNSAQSNSESLRSSPLGGLLADVSNSIDARRTGEFPALNQILAGTMNQPPGQHDPSELYQALLIALKDLSPSPDQSPFSRLFTFDVRHRFGCDSCHTDTYVGTGGDSQPASPLATGYSDNLLRIGYDPTGSRSIEQMLVQSHNLANTSRPQRCSTSGCEQLSFNPAETQMRFTSSLLMVEVTPLENSSDSASASASAVLSGRFDLNSSITFGSEDWKSSRESGSIVWSLAGIICRSGPDRSQGHYVAFIKESGLWWCVDDRTVMSAGSTREAFENHRTPRLLLYTKVSSILPKRPEASSTERSTAPIESRGIQDWPKTPAAAASDNALGKRKLEQDPNTLNRRESHDSDIEEQPSAPRKRPKLGSILPLADLYDPFSSLMEWQQRYNRLEWMSLSDLNPIISAYVTVRSPIPMATFKRLEKAVPRDKLGKYLSLTFGDDNERMLNWGAYITNGMIVQFVRSFNKLLRGTLFHGDSRCATLSGIEFIDWDHSTQRPRLDTQNAGTGGPFPNFDGNSDWRNTRTVCFMSSSFNTHFNAVIVFGPERLVVPYDGLAGSCTDPEIKSRWSNIMSPRMQWELEQGMVKPEDNEGWLVAPNDVHTRSFLDWVPQVDGTSCGPFAIGVMSTAGLGIRPCRDSLGARGSWTEKSAKTLRSSIIGFLIGRVMSELTDFLDANEDYKKHVQKWVFGWAAWKKGKQAL